MRIALIDSGFGLLPTAAWLRTLRPDLDLLLQLDPEGVPWGPKPDTWVIDRVVGAARLARKRGADVVVLPCNTASVTALAQVRAEMGELPVVGTVPAIKPAAAVCADLAVWATATTTASRYQADLIRQFAPNARVTAVACHGLAEAVDRGDLVAVQARIAEAAARTPAQVTGVVLGCTHYPLVADRIAGALAPGVRLFDSARAVANQTLRQVDALGKASTGLGEVEVLLSGREGQLPAGAGVYESGRILGAVEPAESCRRQTLATGAESQN